MDFVEMKLNNGIAAAVKEMGFTAPTPIQEQAIPLLIRGVDLVGQAQTGTGKTAAFGIPLLEYCAGKKGLQALVLVPTRELAVQVAEEITNIGKHVHVGVLAVYGGTSLENQVQHLRQGVSIVVGTPGRLIDHIKRGSIDLSKVKAVVLDEADRMLDMGFIDDVEFILSKTPKERQTALFSATMPGQVLELTKKYMHSPEYVSVSKDELTVKGTRQQYVSVDPRKKVSTLLSFFASHKPTLTIVFCRTKYGADSLARLLAGNGIKAIALHGNLTQNRRTRVMELFKENEIGVLVATDLAARGLDVEDVSHVINFDMPNEAMTYIHRIGRTGRAGKVGDALTFVTNLMELRELRKAVEMGGATVSELRIPDVVRHIAPPAREEREHYNQFAGRGGPRRFNGPRRGPPGQHAPRAGQGRSEGRHSFNEPRPTSFHRPGRTFKR